MVSDRFSLCAGCGTRFVWTAQEQAGAAGQPALCPACRILLPAEERRRGVVKFYNVRNGWGFITQVQGGDVFVHRSGLEEGVHPLLEGELVEFAVTQTGRGPQAVAVERLEETLEEN